jgi:NSS family neurotransmitter:Na+ symporter
MTPIFFVLLVVLGITSSMLPGAWKGLAFYLSPDLSKLTPTTWLMALGQIFFSIGLASAIIVLYGSYMRDKEDVPANSVVASVGDTLVALIAGFAIFPAVFAMGLPPASGPGLVFVIYPMVLAKMPAGVVFAPLFFLAFLFITLTSAIALLEFVVEPLVYRLGWSRRRSVITMGLILWLAGLPACYNFMWLASVDMYLTTILLPICALIAPIALFWFYGSEQALAWANKGASFKLGKWWLYWGKYLYPLIIIIVLVWGIYSTFLAG